MTFAWAQVMSHLANLIGSSLQGVPFKTCTEKSLRQAYGVHEK